MKNAPCKDCKDRAVGCHAICKKYIEWKKERDAILEKINKERDLKYDYYDHKIRVIRKVRGKK